MHEGDDDPLTFDIDVSYDRLDERTVVWSANNEPQGVLRYDSEGEPC